MRQTKRNECKRETFILGKEKRNLTPTQLVGEQRQTPAPFESCGGVRSGSPTQGQETWRTGLGKVQFLPSVPQGGQPVWDTVAITVVGTVLTLRWPLSLPVRLGQSRSFYDSGSAGICDSSGIYNLGSSHLIAHHTTAGVCLLSLGQAILLMVGGCG